MFFRLLAHSSFLLAALLYAPHSQAEQQRYTSRQIQADVDAIEAGIAVTHPDPSHSVDPARIARALDELRRRTRDGMDRDAAWRDLSTLNPIFGDAHLFVTYPDWRGETLQHLKSGGALFPFEVSVDAAGLVRVVSELGGAPTAFAGATIRSINGAPARDIAQDLLARVHGDSPRFRADLLSKRWWFFYWKVHGAPATFHIELTDVTSDPVKLPASRMRPTTMIGEDDFDRNFALELRPDGAAVMTVKTFSWPDPEAFFAFARRSFERMQAAGTHTLLIDVRQNGGGDDAMWLEGLLPYIADRPYRWASRYTKRVLKDNPERRERAGQVLSGEVETWTAPLSDDPRHFDGQVYVLIGAGTYSSAVLFANTVQDFDFGTLVGEGASVKTTQSGGIQSIKLPNTGLVLWVPRFVLVRPSGKQQPEWLTPDILMADNPFDATAMIEATLAKANVTGPLQ